MSQVFSQQMVFSGSSPRQGDEIRFSGDFREASGFPFFLGTFDQIPSLYEGQVHSEECRMGTMLSITAIATEEYARHVYKLEREQIEEIFKTGKSRYELA
jgi:hypothetical protein